MSVSGNKHSLLGQSGYLTSQGWIIIFFRGEITAEQSHEREATGKNDSNKCFLLSLFDVLKKSSHKLLPTKQGHAQP